MPLKLPVHYTHLLYLGGILTAILLVGVPRRISLRHLRIRIHKYLTIPVLTHFNYLDVFEQQGQGA